jgi:hypothetical protein
MTMKQALVAAKNLRAFLKPRLEAVGAAAKVQKAMEKEFGPVKGKIALNSSKAIGIASITGKFFYSMTTIDLRNGDVYQTPPGNQTDFNGPLKPPVNARIVGTFTEAQRLKLADAIRPRG